MTRPRGQLGEGAVLSVSAAAAELGLREADGIRWLRERGLVSTLRLEGRTVERVTWRRVLAVLEQEGDEAAAPLPSSPRKATPPGLRRSTTL